MDNTEFGHVGARRAVPNKKNKTIKQSEFKKISRKNHKF